MAVGAVHAERRRHVHHQPIGPLRVLGAGLHRHDTRRRGLHPDQRIIGQIRGKRIVGQRGQADRGAGLVLPGSAHRKTRRTRRGVVARPGIGRHGLAAVAGVAGDAGFEHMALPLGIDARRHLQHPARHDLGVDFVGGHVVGVVAVVAPLLRRHPAGQRRHGAGELRDRKVAQHLHVLVDDAGLRPGGAHIGDDVRELVLGQDQLLGARVHRLLLGQATVAELHRIHRRPLEGEEQREAADQRRRGGGAFEGVAHFPPPSSGSGSALKDSGG